MSGDTHNDNQPLIFYSTEITKAKEIVLLHRRQKYANEILQSGSYTYQTRWRTGSPMQG